MRKFCFLLALLCGGFSFAEIKTPLSVETFYRGMEQLSKISDINEAEDICRSMKDCLTGFEESSSGIDLPNDFRTFEYDKKNPSHNNNLLNAALYIDRLQEYIFKDRVLNVKYDIKTSEYSGEQPDFSNGRLSSASAFIATYVQKTYEFTGGNKQVFNDTVFTQLSDSYTYGKIYDIKNGKSADNVHNINSLRIKAALAYQQEEYEKAYGYYKEIISIAPQDYDALYRIGLMVYFKPKESSGKKLTHKQKVLFKKQGEEYVKKAELYCRNNPIMMKKITAVINKFEYPIM